jgi:hypothetical protein
MAKLSGAAVLLLVVVPLSMYTYALLVGIQLGRALERGPDNSVGASVEFTWRGALDYVTKVIDHIVDNSNSSTLFMHHLHPSLTYTLCSISSKV